MMTAADARDSDYLKLDDTGNSDGNNSIREESRSATVPSRRRKLSMPLLSSDIKSFGIMSDDTTSFPGTIRDSVRLSIFDVKNLFSLSGSQDNHHTTNDEQQRQKTTEEGETSTSYYDNNNDDNNDDDEVPNPPSFFSNVTTCDTTNTDDDNNNNNNRPPPPARPSLISRIFTEGTIQYIIAGDCGEEESINNSRDDKGKRCSFLGGESGAYDNMPPSTTTMSLNDTTNDGTNCGDIPKPPSLTSNVSTFGDAAADVGDCGDKQPPARPSLISRIFTEGTLSNILAVNDGDIGEESSIRRGSVGLSFLLGADVSEPAAAAAAAVGTSTSRGGGGGGVHNNKRQRNDANSNVSLLGDLNQSEEESVWCSTSTTVNDRLAKRAKVESPTVRKQSISNLFCWTTGQQTPPTIKPTPTPKTTPPKTTTAGGNNRTSYRNARNYLLQKMSSEITEHKVSTMMTNTNGSSATSKKDPRMRVRCVVCCGTCDSQKRNGRNHKNHSRCGAKTKTGCRECYVKWRSSSCGGSTDDDTGPGIIPLCNFVRGIDGSNKTCFEIWHDQQCNDLPINECKR